MNNLSLKVSSRIVVLDVGMYIFRYVSDTPAHPRNSSLSLHQAPVGKGVVDFFPASGVVRNTLTTPGDCVIVRIKGAQASVLVTEYHPEGESAAIQLRIDQISTAPSGPKAVEPSPVPPTQAARLKLHGHIETRGDVAVEDGWLGTPGTPLRLEGFAIEWQGQPQDVTLAYLCRSAKGSEPQVALAGQFVGTRRQAKPITSVAFALTGQRAAQYELSGQVVFGGQPPLAIIPDKELSGPNGTEQLVALRLAITPRAAQVSPPASPWTDTATTHTFRND
ncbi:hypothetical protein [Azotobacter salinestris]|uniref:hypothetical protein n=1 Tax=Azotobacter salinestris TaxID=69964 RepID=UPI0032DFC044